MSIEASQIALKSQEMIVHAMFTLLGPVEYRKISITQLSDQATVSRQTFYALFENKKEVIHYQIEESFRDYQAALADVSFTKHNLIQLFFDFYLKNQSIFNVIFDNQLDAILLDKAKIFLNILNKNDQKIDSYSTTFIASGLVQVLHEWYCKKVLRSMSWCPLLKILLG